MAHAPDPHALALSDAEAYDDLRAHEWENVDRTADFFDAPLLRVAEAALVPDAPEPQGSPASAGTRPLPAPSPPGATHGPSRSTRPCVPAEPPFARPHSDDDPTGRSHERRPVGESPCPRCGGEEVVAIGGPDRFGNYETTDCRCVLP